jgi:tetratricopeptide (TPR) repeat protein
VAGLSVGAVTLAPGDIPILQRAFAQLQAGVAAEAARTLTGLSASGARHPDALYLAALSAELLGQPAEARRCYDLALAAAPHNAAIWNSYGNFLAKVGDRDAAIAAWHQAVAAAPALTEAWLNLANAGIARQDWPLARRAVEKALSLAPGDARVLSARGRLAQGEGRLGEAISAYESALVANPGDLVTRHNLGTALRSAGQPEAALVALERALADGLTAPETATVRAHVLAEIGRFDEAVAAYRGVIARAPGHLDAQTTLAMLLPQIGRGEEALDGFAAALNGPAPREVWAAAIAAAKAVGDAARMQDWAARAERALGPARDWTLAKVSALTLAGEDSAAIAAAEAALAAEPGAPGFAAFLAHCHLRSGNLKPAEHWALVAADESPLEQGSWALLTLIWRLLQDPREQWLADYERLVMVSDLVVPRGWSRLGGFIADLETVLTRMHVTRLAPAEQSLRGGTQTRGRLFDNPDPVIQALAGALTETVELCLAGLRPDPSHPFLKRLTGRIEMAGSWSVRLQSQGFHISHIHQTGWLSSAFYVALPPEVEAGSGGELMFGVPDGALGLELGPRRVVAPKVGRLAIFPSFLWHGTAKFESASPRMTVAFDALPRQTGA